MKLTPKTLVIDASIARASGGKDARHPDAIHARDFLLTLLSTDHKIGMTRSIQGEWNKHQSAFACNWRKTMVAKNKIVVKQVLEDKKLRDMIEMLDIFLTKEEAENAKSAMLKDCHLLEAAEAFDQRIASPDNKARDLFSRASVTIKTIRKLIWVNPIADDAEMAQDWLKQGADDKQKWRLHVT